MCLGGTTTWGPMLKAFKSAVAEERRRTVDRGCGDGRWCPSVIVNVSCCKEGSQSWGFEESWGLVPCSFHRPMVRWTCMHPRSKRLADVMMSRLYGLHETRDESRWWIKGQPTSRVYQIRNCWFEKRYDQLNTIIRLCGFEGYGDLTVYQERRLADL